MKSRALEYDSRSCFLESVLAVVNAREMRRSPSWSVAWWSALQFDLLACPPIASFSAAPPLSSENSPTCISASCFTGRKTGFSRFPFPSRGRIPLKFVANTELGHSEGFTAFHMEASG